MFATGFFLVLAVFLAAGSKRFRAWVDASGARKQSAGLLLVVGLLLSAGSAGWALFAWLWRVLP